MKNRRCRVGSKIVQPESCLLTYRFATREQATFSYSTSDKTFAERRRKLGLPAEDPTASKPPAPVVEENKISLPIRPATKAEQMRESLRSLKQSNKDDEAKVKASFNTLLTYVKNAATKPDEEKFREIRLSNSAFQDRVGKLEGGIKFLELCGFEKVVEGGG